MTPENNYPTAEDQKTLIKRRHQWGQIGYRLFLGATGLAIVALLALLGNVLNGSMGYVITENKVSPESLVAEVGQSGDLADLSADDLATLLKAHISSGLGRRLEREQRFFEDRLLFMSDAQLAALCQQNSVEAICTSSARSQSNILALVVENIVDPTIVETWSLADSITRKEEILNLVATQYPTAELTFRFWLTRRFVTNPQSSRPVLAGVGTAFLGSLWIVAITALAAFPVGVGAAIYLQEYARDTWVNRIIQTNISNLAGVPSIIYGMLGLAIFVRTLETVTSGAFFGLATADGSANGRTILSAALTLALLILPLIIINAQEAIRAVPTSLRQASYGLGATQWQTIWHHVLPNSLPGILTGTILAMSRALGETAPLVVVGASTFITINPDGPFSKFTTLPIQIYQWTSRPQGEFSHLAAAAILVLLILLLSLNATAVLLRNRYATKGK